MRTTKSRLAVITFAIVICSIAIVIHVAKPPLNSPIARALQNSLHGPGFGGIALVSMVFLRQWLAPFSAYKWAAIFSLGLGIIAEAAQVMGPRDADLSDVVRDLVGIAGFLGVAASIDWRREKLPRWLLRKSTSMFAWILGLAAVVPVFWFTYGLTKQYEAYPAILTFDHLWESPIYSGVRRGDIELIPSPPSWPIATGRVAAVQMKSGRHPGLEFQPNADWSRHSALSFIAASSTNTEIEVSVQIDDSDSGYRYANRFNTMIVVGPTPKRYRVTVQSIMDGPEGRKLNVDSISKVAVFTAKPAKGQSLLLDDFRLEP